MSASAELVCVEPSKVPQVWPFVSEMISAAMDRGGMGDFESVADDVHASRALLWLVWDGVSVLAAAVTELTKTPRDKVCTIVACGGQDRVRWLHLIEKLEAHAKEEGCARVRICGRRGWTRALEDYSVRAVVLEKELG